MVEVAPTSFLDFVIRHGVFFSYVLTVIALSNFLDYLTSFGGSVNIYGSRGLSFLKQRGSIGPLIGRSVSTLSLHCTVPDEESKSFLNVLRF